MITNNMETQDLIPVIADLRDELMQKDPSAWCDRKEEKRINPNSTMAQVVIGVRRCGKSTLCEKVIMQQGVDCAYVNFDDERLFGLKTSDLNKLLEAIYVVYGDVKCMMFDEIQNIGGWPLFVNRLLRQGVHLIITGSNSKLLSSELATHLTGRHDKIELFPFSFAEYCAIHKVDTKAMSTKASALRINLLHQYLMEGGFPELDKAANKRAYIDALIDAIVKNDVTRRFKVRNPDVLRRMAAYLSDNFAQEFNAMAVGKLFGISDHTAENYYSYLKEAFLLCGVTKFSYKSKERVCKEKAYVVDVALCSLRENCFSPSNLGWRLENVVYIELQRRFRPRYTDVFYYRDRSFEVDFVVAKSGSVEQLIQVSYDISGTKTRNREISALLKGAKKFNCHKLTLINLMEKNTVAVNGETIEIMPAVEWLLRTE